MKNILIFRKHKNVLLRKGDHYFVVRFLQCWQGKMLTKKSFLLSPALIFWTDHIHNISLKNASKIQVLHQHQHRIFSVKNCLNWCVPHTKWLYDNRSLKIQRMSWMGIWLLILYPFCKCANIEMQMYFCFHDWGVTVWYRVEMECLVHAKISNSFLTSPTSALNCIFIMQSARLLQTSH